MSKKQIYPKYEISYLEITTCREIIKYNKNGEVISRKTTSKTRKIVTTKVTTRGLTVAADAASDRALSFGTPKMEDLEVYRHIEKNR